MQHDLIEPESPQVEEIPSKLVASPEQLQAASLQQLKPKQEEQLPSLELPLVPQCLDNSKSVTEIELETLPPPLTNPVVAKRASQSLVTKADLSSDQLDAYNKIFAWLEKTTGSEQLSLGGYAGTGKTTLLRLIVDDPSWRPCVMSLTGKAVSVLVKKGVDAATIHSTIYHVDIVKNKPIFYLRDSIQDHPELLIIDEASMVSKEVYKDLLSFKLPILWVGDHGQLEPVGENPDIMKNPDIRLEKIHRQAEGNPIIMFADKVRRGAAPAAIASKKDEDKVRVVEKSQLNASDYRAADQIICAMNRTRVRINKLMRTELGFPNQPVHGDRVMCLKNKRQVGIFNGLQGVIKEITPDSNRPVYQATIELDTGQEFKGEILKAQFHHSKGLVEVPKELSQATHFDYCYAITCHKAQGSEWSTVIVIEESCPVWSMARWRYTAVTRASKRLIYAT